MIDDYFKFIELKYEKNYSWHEVILKSITNYKSNLNTLFADHQALPEHYNFFVGMDLTDVMQYLSTETGIMASLNILAVIESKFREDYIKRSGMKKSIPLNRYFFELYKEKGDKVNLERDILEGWKNNYYSPSSINKIISEIKTAFKYRHWLAHGRYWSPNQAWEKYDFFYFATLYEAIDVSFPFEE